MQAEISICRRRIATIGQRVLNRWSKLGHVPQSKLSEQKLRFFSKVKILKNVFNKFLVSLAVSNIDICPESSIISLLIKPKEGTKSLVIIKT